MGNQFGAKSDALGEITFGANRSTSGAGITPILLIAVFAALSGRAAVVVTGPRHRASRKDQWIPLPPGLCRP